ncbi:MAG: long-chain fatty acid--CoA ligase [Leptospiraceae bacterium]|nr:long-chain fatty acid--CoA ligase [Leptospiraceae bacterium]
MQKSKTLAEMFEAVNQKYGSKKMFFTKDKNKNFQGETFASVYTKSENLALALIELGLKPGDRVGHMADNRMEWALTDMAIIMAGACNTPRGTDSTPQEMEYILSHSDSEFCIVENDATLDKVLQIRATTKVKYIIVMENTFNAKGAEGVMSLEELLKKGKDLRSAKLAELKSRIKAIKPDDLFTIIYTSGTTGNPKGVMLSHENMMYNINNVPAMVGMNENDSALSILPVWHIFERAIDYAGMSMGCQIYYTNVRDVREDFAKAKPTFMASAPRLWENLYNGIKQKTEKASPVQKKVFDFAYEVNKLWKESVDYLQGNKLLVKPESDLEKFGKTAVSLFTAVNLFVPAKVLDSVVFSKIRDALGGRLKGSISGGGALPAHVDQFFNVVGIPVYEGYGMTECAPIISVRTTDHLVQGSVGFTPDGTEVALLDEKGSPVAIGELGVIHVRGPQVMKGYYKNEEATKNVLKDGWLNTGDLGFMSVNGTLSIRGRVKDTIVLIGGENVEPIPIENLLVENPLVNQVIVVGQDKKSLTALIWPDFEKLKSEGHNVQPGDDLNKNTAIRELFTKMIKKTVSSENGFKGFERLTDFRFLPKPMEIGDEITNLYKMKRNVISQKYKDLIDSMY